MYAHKYTHARHCTDDGTPAAARQQPKVVQASPPEDSAMANNAAAALLSHTSSRARLSSDQKTPRVVSPSNGRQQQH